MTTLPKKELSPVVVKLPNDKKTVDHANGVNSESKSRIVDGGYHQKKIFY